MPFYCGIDLGARTSQVCLIDDRDQVLFNLKTQNDLGVIIGLLKSYRHSLQIVVESTFNWYWLVDGLQEAHFDIKLAHTFGLFLITKAKVKTDRRDALTLARLLRTGAIHEAYIYPRQSRSLRDLIRARTRLVQMRSREYTSLRRLLYQQGSLEHSRNSIQQVEEEDLDRWFHDSRVRLMAYQEYDRIFVFSEQITELEKEILETARQRPNYRRLMQVPGLGEILAVIAYYETGDVTRFASGRHYSSYCRVVPGSADSCTVRRRGRGSKRGNAHLKSAYSQAAIYARRYYPRIRRCYDRHLKRHTGFGGRLIANNVIAHKLSLASYHILRDGTDYEERRMFGN